MGEQYNIIIYGTKKIQLYVRVSVQAQLSFLIYKIGAQYYNNIYNILYKYVQRRTMRPNITYGST